METPIKRSESLLALSRAPITWVESYPANPRAIAGLHNAVPAWRGGQQVVIQQTRHQVGGRCYVWRGGAKVLKWTPAESCSDGAPLLAATTTQ